MTVLGMPLWAVISLFIFAALLIPQLYFWFIERPKYQRPKREKPLLVSTEDGWRISLTHVPPKSPTANVAPVICIPGLVCNTAIFDLNQEHSLANSLAERGIDVWLLDLRGAGASDRAGQKSATLENTVLPFCYGLKEYALLDTMAAIDAVKQATGAEKVSLLGHSLGGIISYLAASKRNDIASIVGLASPFDFSEHKKTLGGFYYHLLHFVGRHRLPVMLAFLSRFIVAYFCRFLPIDLAMQPRMIAGPARRQMALDSLVDVPPQLFFEFSHAICEPHENSDRLMPTFGDTRAQQMLNLNMPILTLAAEFDRLAPESSVQAIRNHIVEPGPQKHLFFKDFGHVDIVIGDTAIQKVHPPIAEFLLTAQKFSQPSHDAATIEAAQ